MGFHTFDADRAAQLDRDRRYRWCSAEELHAQVTPHEGATIADLGSGTGFYTDAIAPDAGTVYAVDIQSGMHERYRERGLPATVELVQADIGALPFETDALDGAFSTMTYHEFSGPEAVAELARVLRPGARLVTVDWSRHGAGESGPPRDQRHDLGHVTAAVTEAGFTVEHAVTRTETFVCRARR